MVNFVLKERLHVGKNWQKIRYLIKVCHPFWQNGHKFGVKFASVNAPLPSNINIQSVKLKYGQTS